MRQVSGQKASCWSTDTLILRDRMAMAMRQRGFQVQTAGNYEEAVEIFHHSPTDLAVLDLRMPGRTGLDLLRKLLQMSPSTRNHYALRIRQHSCVH